MDELKPCPFCNGNAFVAMINFYLNQTDVSVKCKKCGAESKIEPVSHWGYDYETRLRKAKQTVSRRWNRRFEADGAK